MPYDLFSSVAESQTQRSVRARSRSVESTDRKCPEQADPGRQKFLSGCQELGRRVGNAKGVSSWGVKVLGQVEAVWWFHRGGNELNTTQLFT